MSTYKELAEHLEAYFKNAHRMDEVIAILCSLDAQPVAEVSVMGSYHGKPILGCVLSNDSMQVGDKLYAVPVAAQPTDLEAMRQQKDGAYFERNQVVAALAKCFPSGVAKTAIEGWSEDWHGCVYIDLPTGQVSWHFHDSQAYLFKDLPPYAGAWDGHDTAEKYRRVNALTAQPQQASKPLSDEPNMFWNHDDPESPYGSIDEFLNDEWSQNGIAVGDIRRVQRAIRLPDVMVRVTAVSDDGDIDYIVEPVGGIKERG